MNATQYDPQEILEQLGGMHTDEAAARFVELYDGVRVFAEEIYSVQDMMNAFATGVRWSSREIHMEAYSE